MIIEVLITLITGFVKVLFGWINLPQAPNGASSTITSYFDLIFNNLDFLGFFVRIDTFKVVATVAILLISFKKLYQVTMWIVRKLPININ